jgi:hypothetical protein
MPGVYRVSNGPIDNRPDPEGTPDNLPHKAELAMHKGLAADCGFCMLAPGLYYLHSGRGLEFEERVGQRYVLLLVAEGEIEF